MNAPHPFRTANAHLFAVATSLDAVAPVAPIDQHSYDRGAAAASLTDGVEALDQATYCIEGAVRRICAAVEAGACHGYGVPRLGEIAQRLSDAALKAETATSTIISMGGVAS